MVVFHPVTRNRTTHTICQPGAKYPVSEWLTEDGLPKTMVVEFKYGKAEVADNLGRFLIDSGYAQSSQILLVN